MIHVSRNLSIVFISPLISHLCLRLDVSIQIMKKLKGLYQKILPEKLYFPLYTNSECTF